MPLASPNTDAVAVPPTNTSSLGFTSAICFSTKGWQMASSSFVGWRLPGGAPEQRVSDVKIFGTLEANETEHGVEQLAAWPTEGNTRAILLGPGGLADEHQATCRHSLREYGVGSGFFQPATLEPTYGSFKRRQIGGRIGERTRLCHCAGNGGGGCRLNAPPLSPRERAGVRAWIERPNRHAPHLNSPWRGEERWRLHPLCGLLSSAAPLRHRDPPPFAHTSEGNQRLGRQFVVLAWALTKN